jgi:hypothetical protein
LYHLYHINQLVLVILAVARRTQFVIFADILQQLLSLQLVGSLISDRALVGSLATIGHLLELSLFGNFFFPQISISEIP